MYSPVANVGEEHSEGSPSFKISLWLLTSAVWVAALLFASFTIFHYVLSDHSKTWDETDPGLYRKQQPVANYLILFHFLGGIFLMLIGPIQLISTIRQRFLLFHRWTGRVYILASIMASGCATLFVLMYGTSRGNVHENVGNVIFGSAAFLCAIQSYRHAAITKKIECHKLWSWRLYAVIFGAVLYRLYVVVYYAFVFFTPWNGNEFIYNALYYALTLPNLAVVELIWRQQGKRLHAQWLVLCTLFVVTTCAMVTFYSWLPAMLGTPTRQAEALGHEKNYRDPN